MGDNLLPDTVAQEDYAFPWVSDRAGHLCTGMTLRDWFAGQALPGYVQHLGSQNIHAGNYIEECAREAYAFADAMLAARKDHPHG